MPSWPLKFMARQFDIDLVDERDPNRERMLVEAHQQSQMADAKALVREWNRRVTAGVDTQFSPSIGCAVRAGTPWLRLYCPSCQTVGEKDLRTIVRPKTFPIEAIKFTCDFRCRGRADPPVLKGLFKFKDSPPYAIELDAPADHQGDPPSRESRK